MASKRTVDIVVKARDRASKAFRKISGATKRLSNSFLTLRSAAIGALGGFALVRATQNIVKAFAVQEAAVKGLGDALGLLGAEARATLPEMEKFASQIQKQTVIGDEAVLQLAALGASLGKLSGQALKDATTAAIGLSRRLKIDTVSAMRLVARAAVGDTSSLSRYGLKLKETLSPQEKFNELLRIGAASFALARGEIDTLTGKFTQLTNAVGDLQEGIGSGLSSVLRDGIDAAQSFTEILASLSRKEIQDLIDQAKIAGLVLIAVVAAPKLIGGIRIAISGMRLLAGAVGGIGAAATLGVGIAIAAIVAMAAAAKLAMFKIQIASRTTGRIIAGINEEVQALREAPTTAAAEAALSRIIQGRKKLAELLRDEIDREEDDALRQGQRAVLRSNLRSLKQNEAVISEIRAKARAERAKADIESARVTAAAAAAAAIKAEEAVRKTARDKQLGADKRHTNRILQLRIQAITDELQRETALIDARYDREVQTAQEAGQKIALIEQARAIELAALQKRLRDENAEDAERSAKRRRSGFGRDAAAGRKDGGLAQRPGRGAGAPFEAKRLQRAPGQDPQFEVLRRIQKGGDIRLSALKELIREFQRQGTIVVAAANLNAN